MIKNLLSILLFLLTICSGYAQENPRTIELDSITIIGVTPVQGMALEKDKLPVSIQKVNNRQFESAQSLDITDFMNRNLGSVNINTAGGNDLQPDLNYRGFTASPLLGLPQGLSIYQDGVRINELFGDVVNWELLPENALSTISIVPGSNPLFGLNTLGGAISVRTNSGFTREGTNLSLFGGSFGRLNLEASTGGNNGKWGYFVSAGRFQEDGWRNFSQSEVSQAFGKVSYRGEKSKSDFSVTFADSDLRGNGAAPIELLEMGREEVFTHPDNTQNNLWQFIFNNTTFVSDEVSITVNGYYRRKETSTFNGDDSAYEECEDPEFAGVLCQEEGLEEEEEEEEPGGEEEEQEPVLDQNGNTVPATDEFATATNNRSNTLENAFGGTVQLNIDKELGGKENHFVAGINAYGGSAAFNSSTEFAELNEDRGTTGSEVFDGGSFVEVDVQVTNVSAYISESYFPVDELALTVSANANYVNIVLDDQLGTALNGDHEYFRVNPSAGFVYDFGKANVYGNFAVSARAPSPVELTCADPEAPCRLPNGFLADPPLDQVVSNTFETGVRGTLAKTVNWSLGGFLTNVSDDIYFVSAGPARNSGFFTNIGNTRRLGVEASLTKSVGKLQGFLHYTFMNATFEENFTVNSPFHPNADEGEIEVSAGNRIPLLPQHIFKTGLNYSITNDIMVGAEILSIGSSFIRGDESNELGEDQQLQAYTLLNLRAEYQPLNFLGVFVKANNVLNIEYETFGLLGEPDEVDAFEDFEEELFLTPGVPFYFQAGVELSF